MKKYLKELEALRTSIKQLDDQMDKIVKQIAYQEKDSQVNHLIEEHLQLEEQMKVLIAKVTVIERQMAEDPALVSVMLQLPVEDPKNRQNNLQETTEEITILGDPETGAMIPVTATVDEPPITIGQFESYQLKKSSRR